MNSATVFLKWGDKWKKGLMRYAKQVVMYFRNVFPTNDFFCTYYRVQAEILLLKHHVIKM
jgi:hypothetical protein